MAKKDKPDSFEAQREAEAKAAKKKLKEAEKASKAKGDKAEKAPKKKKAVRFFKDFRGELKKIVWPDFKTVMKNTGIVLVTVVIIGAMVWVLDYILSGSVRGLKNLAQGVTVAETTVDFGDYTETEAVLTTAAEATTEAATATGDAAEATTEPVTEPTTEATTVEAAE